MKEAWWRNKAQEIQEAADTHNMKYFYEGLKAVYGPKSSGSSPLLSSDCSRLLTDREDILKRWAEHFNNVLNRDSVVDNDVISSIAQLPVLEAMGVDPTVAEVKKAIKHMSNGKAPGQDGIPAEVYKYGGNTLVQKLTKLFCVIWNCGTVPQQLKMRPLSICTRTKERNRNVITIVEYRFFLLLEKFLLALFSTE